MVNGDEREKILLVVLHSSKPLLDEGISMLYYCLGAFREIWDQGQVRVQVAKHLSETLSRPLYEYSIPIPELSWHTHLTIHMSVLA